MSFKLRLANRLILSDTRHPIDPEGRRQVVIPCGADQIEAWVIESEREADVLCLKFPGTGGRAERAGPHPCDLVAENFEVWAINPPGYGSSTGSACVSKMNDMCDAAWQAIYARADGRPIVVTGNSLGGIYALFVAARYSIAGLLLRNPAPIHQLIKGKHSWWNAGLASRLVASQVPIELDAVANAAESSAPALFVMSERDRVIPPKYQHMIMEQYAGPYSRFLIPDADHHHPIPEEQADDYIKTIETWGKILRKN